MLRRWAMPTVLLLAIAACWSCTFRGHYGAVPPRHVPPPPAWGFWGPPPGRVYVSHWREAERITRQREALRREQQRREHEDQMRRQRDERNRRERQDQVRRQREREDDRRAGPGGNEGTRRPERATRDRGPAGDTRGERREGNGPQGRRSQPRQGQVDGDRGRDDGPPDPGGEER